MMRPSRMCNQNESPMLYAMPRPSKTSMSESVDDPGRRHRARARRMASSGAPGCSVTQLLTSHTMRCDQSAESIPMLDHEPTPSARTMRLLLLAQASWVESCDDPTFSNTDTSSMGVVWQADYLKKGDPLVGTCEWLYADPWLPANPILPSDSSRNTVSNASPWLAASN